MIPKFLSNISLFRLESEGIEDIVLDVDGTIKHLYHKKMKQDPGIKPEIIWWIKKAQINDFNVHILSNSTNVDKVLEIANICGIDQKRCLCRGNGERWKPRNIDKALEKLGIIDPSSSVMIGNNLLWDWLAPKFFGMKSILVGPNFYKTNERNT